MDIYIVTEGEYSDYSIRAVFTDKAKAEQYLQNIKLCHPHEKSQIEEWSTEEHEEIARKCWRSEIDLVTGELNEVQYHHDGDEDGMYYSYVMASPTDRVSYLQPMEYPLRYNGHISNYWAASLVSQEHANKLVIEARQEFLRRVDVSKIVVTSESGYGSHKRVSYRYNGEDIHLPPFMPEV